MADAPPLPPAPRLGDQGRGVLAEPGLEAPRIDACWAARDALQQLPLR